MFQSTIVGFYGLKTMGLGILRVTKFTKAVMLVVAENFMSLILMAIMILISFLHRKATTRLTGMKTQAELPPPGLLTVSLIAVTGLDLYML